MSEPTEARFQQSSLAGLQHPFASGVFGRSEILGLKGSSDAWFAAGLLARKESAETLLVVAADQAEAQRFYRALSFFHGRQADILFFPHWETEPYAPLSPHPEIEATRLSTLAALASGRGKAVVTTVKALQQKILPRQVLDSLSLQLEVGSEMPRDDSFAGVGFARLPARQPG